MQDFLSELDTERFGFRVAKIPSDLDNPELVIRNLETLSTKLIIARVDLKNLVMINRLEKLGFLIKDTQLTFNYNLKDYVPRHKRTGFSINSFKECYIKQIIEITEKSFNNYGHYFADEKLDRKKCLDIYIDWIKNCCYKKSFADNIIVAEKEGKLIGYLALKTYNNTDSKYTAGVIGAVAKEYRKEGVFQAINTASMNWAKSEGSERIENNVLITNFAVQNTYLKLKFSIIRSEVTMHYWFESKSKVLE